MPASRAALICNNFDPHGSGTPQLHENKKFVNHPLQRITFPQASPARRQRLAKLRVVQHATDRRSKGGGFMASTNSAQGSPSTASTSRNTCRSLATTGTPAWAASTGASPKLSVALGKTKQSSDDRKTPIIRESISPRKCTRSRTPSSTAIASRRSCRFPVRPRRNAGSCPRGAAGLQDRAA